MRFHQWCFGAVEDVGVIGKRRVVDQDIDTAEARGNLLHHLLDLRRIGYIAQHEHGFTAAFFEILDHRLAAALMHFDDSDSRALGGKEFCDSFADISSSAGNYCHLTF